MHRINSSVDVQFPYEKPYPCQLDIMSKVVECVMQGHNGLIESPTGTGKTLSIICAAIATLSKMRSDYRSKKVAERLEKGQDIEIELDDGKESKEVEEVDNL